MSNIIVPKRFDFYTTAHQINQFTFKDEVLDFDYYIEHVREVGRELPPLEFDCFCKPVSPMITMAPRLCSTPEQLDHCSKSLLAIGRFVEMAPTARNEFTNISDWNNGKFKYSLRRFGYIPRKPDHTFQEVAQIYFSPSKTLMCYGTKAELMIAAYWKFLDHPQWGSIIRAIITYAVDMYHRHTGSEAYKGARYLFELAFAFNYFVRVLNESQTGLAHASVHATTLKYDHIQEFGAYRIYQGTACESTDNLYYMYAFPRTITDIPFNPKTLFYIPYSDEVGDDSTSYFRYWMEKALLRKHMNAFLTDAAKIWLYTSKYISQGASKNPDYISFPDAAAAQGYVDNRKQAIYISGIDVYCCLKVRNDVGYFRAKVMPRAIASYIPPPPPPPSIIPPPPPSPSLVPSGASTPKVECVGEKVDGEKVGDEN